ncbi:MAG: DUF6475 domain-containing protein [Thauera sp.]|jgi:hypothetical protein|nr:DUF6475 domain-containing protein [Thauera sp.]
MQEHDFDAFSEMLQAVAEYCGKPLSPGVIAIYWQGLKDLDLAAVRHALNAHVQNPDTGQFMPKIADVRRMLGGTTQDSALRAWAKVDRAVRHVGTYASVAFDDPLIHRVLHDMGGWVGLGSKTEDEWPFVAREFENRYRGYAMRGERPEYPPVLIGISEAENGRRGLHSDPPRLIGEACKAEEVMRNGTSRPLIGFATAGVGALQAAEQSLRLIDANDRAAA